MRKQSREPRPKSALGDEEYIGWDDIIKWLIDAKAPPKNATVKITREAAIRGQLESAIILWFLEGDVAAIHALASAAQELLQCVGRTKGKSSPTVKWIKSQPKATQVKLRSPQNFFKHANVDTDEVLDYPTMQGDMYLIDAVASFHDVFSKVTPLMRLFAARLTLENPDILRPSYTSGWILWGAKIEDIAQLCRSDFLAEAVCRVPKTHKAAS